MPKLVTSHSRIIPVQLYYYFNEGDMNIYLRTSFVMLCCLFVIEVARAGDDDVVLERWSINFTTPQNNSTLYSLGGSWVEVLCQWSVNTGGSSLWRVRFFLDGEEISLPEQSSSRTIRFAVGNHTVTVKLYYYNVLGQEIFVVQDARNLTVDLGVYTVIKTNLPYGALKKDGVIFYANPHGIETYFTPGSHTLEAFNQNHDNWWHVFTHWLKDGALYSTASVIPENFSNSVTYYAFFYPKPTTPGNLHNIGQSGNIQIGWSASTIYHTSNIQWYDIERKIGNGGWMSVATTGSLTFIDSELSYDLDQNPNMGDVVVRYRVTAVSTDDIRSNVSDVITINNGRYIPEKRGEENRFLDFALEQNHPNPFNPSTTISYTIPIEQNVKIMIYNIAGQQVDQLVNSRKSPGHHSVTWDASHMPSGVYFISIVTEQFYQVKRMVYSK